MSSVNHLIGTHAYLTQREQDIINIQESKLLCIDTSNNRIGINTIDPSYSIHVENNTIYQDSSIYSYNIVIPNRLDVSYIEVSNNFKICNSINDNSNMEIYYVDSCLNVILNNLPDSSIGLPNYALYHQDGVIKIIIPS